MTDIKPTDTNPAKPAQPKLPEVLYGLFYELFRGAGISLGINHLEKIEATSAKLAKALEKAALESTTESKNLEKIIKLGDSLLTAIQGVERDVAKLTERMVDQEKKTEMLDDRTVGSVIIGGSGAIGGGAFNFPTGQEGEKLPIVGLSKEIKNECFPPPSYLKDESELLKTAVEHIRKKASKLNVPEVADEGNKSDN